MSNLGVFIATEARIMRLAREKCRTREASSEASDPLQLGEPRLNRGIWDQRKSARTKPVVAIKAVARKLARACYHVMRDQVPFDVQRTFA